MEPAILTHFMMSTSTMPMKREIAMLFFISPISKLKSDLNLQPAFISKRSLQFHIPCSVKNIDKWIYLFTYHLKIVTNVINLIKIFDFSMLISFSFEKLHQSKSTDTVQKKQNTVELHITKSLGDSCDLKYCICP